MKSKKYTTGQNLAYMLRIAWDNQRSVIWFCLLLAAVTVCLNMTELYAAPAILGKLEQSVSVGALTGTIGFFSAMLFLLTTARNYISEICFTGRIYVRELIIKDVVKKSCVTSLPNRQNPEAVRLLQGAHQATDSNSMGTEHIWATLTRLLTNLGAFGFCLALLSELNPILAAVVVLTTVVGFAVSRRINEWEYRHREEKGKLYTQMQYAWTRAESMEFAKDIRVFGLRPWLEDIYSSAVRLFEAFIFRREKVLIWGNLLDIVLTAARNGIAYAYLIGLALEQGLTAAEFLLYFSAVSVFTDMVTGILSELATMHKECLEIGTVREWLDYPEQFRFAGGKPVPAAEKFELRLENVTFAYPGADSPIFRNLNLTIHPGEKLAVVGLNGAGKTTLVKLLCGFYDPDEGRVLLNGQDIRDFNRQDYYRLLSAVYQDFSLLSATIAENIALSVDAIDRNRVWNCLEKAGLADFVRSLPGELDAHVGREVYLDGTLFSGGQTQRLVLARALYKDGPILVLDEPTAALDPIAEAEIYSKFNDIAGDKTAIYISHCLSSCKFCDEIAVFHEGAVIQQGSHETLLADDQGKYHALWNAQAQYYTEKTTE